MVIDQPAVALAWHDQARILGVQVRAFFFDPEVADAQTQFVARHLPVFAHARPRRLYSDDATMSFTAGDLAAQPDAVLEHGQGLLCLTYRHTQRQRIEPQAWALQLRVDVMLPCIASAMAVAGAHRRPAAALLRMANACFQFAPSPPVLECLASAVPAARRYWKASAGLTAAQLAGFCEPRLRSLPGVGIVVGAASPLGADVSRG